MSRKTVIVESLRVTVNELLAKNMCTSDVRQGMMNVLEIMLHETGNYRGFKYLSASEVPAKQFPGINVGNGVETLDYFDRFVDTDKTRVCYF